MPLSEAEKCLFLSRCWEILSKKMPAGPIYYNGLPERPATWAAFAYWVVPLVLTGKPFMKSHPGRWGTWYDLDRLSCMTALKSDTQVWHILQQLREEHPDVVYGPHHLGD